MNSVVTGILVFAFAALCLGFSVIFMPAAELLPAQAQLPSATANLQPGLSPVRIDPVMKFYAGVAQQIVGNPDLKQYSTSTLSDGAPGEVKSYLVYSVGFALAMIAAAIAINAVGRYDSEEKTVIPVKK